MEKIREADLMKKRVGRILLGILIVLVFSVVFAMNVFAAQESEPNNKAADATKISVNTDVTGNISSGSDTDWYKFTLSQSGVISVSFSHPVLSSTDTYWYIYIYQSDGVTGIEGNSNVRWSVAGNKDLTTSEIGLAAGSYYIKVIPYSSSRNNTSNYTLKVNYTQTNSYEKEVNNASTTATSITTNTDYYGAINSNSDVDWYKFTTSGDGKISVSFSHPVLSSTDTYWYIYIYQSDGVTGIEGNSNVRWSVAGNKDLTTSEIGLTAGTYYIRIIPYSSSRYDASTYTLKVNYSQTNNYEKEVNNASTTATSITTNTDYYGAINSNSDVDWYKFTTSGDGKIAVAFSHPVLSSTDTYWYIYIYQSDGVTGIEGNSNIRWSVAGNKDLTTSEIGLPAGTYYIKIIPYSSSRYDTSTYTLKVNFTQTDSYEKEINNSQSNANKIDIMTSYYGAVNSTADVDWYVFEISNKAEITVTFGHPSNGESNTYWVINSYTADGVTKLRDAISVPGNQNVEYALGELNPGTYYIKISPYSSSRMDSSTYTININEKHDCKGAWQVTSEATCDASGTREQVCEICGKVLKTETIAAKGHSYAEWIVDRAATCSSEGERHSACAVCGAESRETIAKLDHTFGELRVLEEPTCTSKGRSVGVCTVCNAEITNDIEMLAHEYGEWSVEKAATCTSNGTESRTCRTCSSSESRTIEAYTHQFGEWQVISGNKLIPPIVKEKTCALCGESETVKDWSYVWVTVIAGIALLGVLIGVINYFRAFKNRR